MPSRLTNYQQRRHIGKADGPQSIDRTSSVRIVPKSRVASHHTLSNIKSMSFPRDINHLKPAIPLLFKHPAIRTKADKGALS